MRGRTALRLVALVAIATAGLACPACTARADILYDPWIRGSSSVAVNDDATALLVNPAGLGINDDSNSYLSLSVSGDDVLGFTTLAKKGPLGLGYYKQHLWESPEDADQFPGDKTVDVYYLGFALGEPRSFSVGFDYRWFRPQFGDKDRKSGTWDVGAMYRPTAYLSLGAAARNLSEPREFSVADSGECACATKTTYVAGVAVRPLGSRVTFMVDAAVERGQEPVYTAGLEAELTDGVVARGSVQSFSDGDGRDHEFSAGLWFLTTHVGLGASYRGMDAAQNPVMSYGIATSEERWRSTLRSVNRVAEVEIAGPLSDFRPGWSLLGEPRNSAQAVIRDLRKAAEDGSVSCVLLNIKPLGSPFLGGPSALVQEIRDEIVRVKRERGMKVLAFLEYGGGTQEYFLATAADKIMIHPVTGIEGIGNYVTVNRFTGATEKIGIEWDYLSAGKYKSTFHSLGAGPLTDDQRKEVQSLTDEIYRHTIDAVVEGRGLSRARAEELCDGRMFIPEKAMEAGLIDDIGTYDDAKAAALEMIGRDVPDDPEQIATVNVSDWVYRDYNWGSQPTIAVVGAYGEIHEGRGGTDPLRGGQSIGSETLVKALRSARMNPAVKAVVLRVDSGGGSGLASDLIWYETVKVAKEKPLIVSMGDVAASGGYYIAIEGEKIFVEPLTITGSIGVVAMMPVFAELFNKVDATYETFRSAEHADQFSPMRKLTDDEREMATEVIEWFYNEFTEKAAVARGMSVDRLRDLAEGKVYMGSQAADVGLVDEFGGLSAAIDYACEKVGVERKDARIVYYREGRSFFDEILGNAAAKLRLWRLFDLGNSGMRDLTTLEAFGEGVVSH
ncbi:MAG: signal peptide peptidase SppA [Candidatus Eisenbacteria bacterium]|nr:signal peptide peptidase SppA [Candidatus Eisenbacteria bacterium]